MSVLDHTLAEAADLVARGGVSARDLTAAALVALETRGRGLNAVARLDPDRALAEAERLDRERRAGQMGGPLHGVPLAHKAMFYRSGRPTDLGSRIRRGYVPEVTAAALERLDAADAVDLGQLNMVEFALGLTGLNAITGHPRNPWNPGLVPGGSSSGSAVAVAARLVPAALGSDTGGSIRVPAACCNLVGLKPTYGRVSRHGAMPLSPSLDHVGALTRTALDAALMLEVLAGPDPRDRSTSPRPAPKAEAVRREDLRGLRVAFAKGPFEIPVHPEIMGHLEATARLLEAAGAKVEPVRLPALRPLNERRNLLMRVEAACHHAPWLKTRSADYQAQTRVRMEGGDAVRAVAYSDALRQRGRLVERFVRTALGGCAALLMPALAAPVPTVAQASSEGQAFLDLVAGLGHFIFPFNYLGLPAVTVPTEPLADGSPMAAQVVGWPFGETLLLRIAHALDMASGFSRRRPPGS